MANGNDPMAGARERSADRKRSKSRLRAMLALSAAAVFALDAAPALAVEEEAEDDQTIIVTGVNAPVTTSTGLPLTFMETPQSVMIIDQERIQDYALTNIKDLLDQVVGVTVERLETDRASFTSRGFDVTNFQIDGVGLPLTENTFYGDTDSFLYERIDIIRGANGLTTGVGNPSATINYIRKRPIFDDTRVNAGAYFGSWDKRRIEADVSTPVGDRWAIRVMGAYDETDSYLDKYHVNREVFGAVVAGKLTDDLTLTAGYHRQRNDSTSPTWVSLVLLYSDGTLIPYERSANNAAPWSYWDITEQQAYSELAYTTGDWTVKGVLTYRHYADDFQFVNQYGFPDRVTGVGLSGDTSQFSSTNRRILGDLFATGKVHAFGREHQLTFGASYGRARQKTFQGRGISDAFPGYVDYPDFNVPDPFDVPEPAYAAPGIQHNQTDKLTRLYAASQIEFTDYLKAVVGASWTKAITKGIYYGEVRDTNESKLNPYVGLLADITPFLTLYGSYTTIFSPQTQPDINRQQLAPVKGINMEVGIKANLFDKRFYVNAALFRTKQKGLATLAGFVEEDNGEGFELFAYYEPEDTTSKGFEFEVAGKITPNWSLSGGFTTFKISNTLGTVAQPHIPRKLLKLSTTYEIPELNNASVGAQMRWQSGVAIAVDGWGPVFPNVPVLRQPDYAIVDLMAGVDIVDNVRATVNMRNITNKLYYTTMAYAAFGYGMYGPGRSYVASLSYRF